MVNVYGVSGDMLRMYIEKIERLEQEKSDVAQVIKETFADAKAQGFDIKVVRQIIKERKIEAHKLEEYETLVAMYKRAIGMLPELDVVEETVN